MSKQECWKIYHMESERWRACLLGYIEIYRNYVRRYSAPPSASFFSSVVSQEMDIPPLSKV